MPITKMTHCFSCGAFIPDMDGPVHAYMDSSPGCWRLYGDILAKEYKPEVYDPNTHRITVDAYAVQHPGKAVRRAIQSVHLHLMSLYGMYEKNLSGEQATQLLKRVVGSKKLTDTFMWLEPPQFEGTKNVTDVLKAKNLEEHNSFVRAWGDSLWRAWKEKHPELIGLFFRQCRSGKFF